MDRQLDKPATTWNPSLRLELCFRPPRSGVWHALPAACAPNNRLEPGRNFLVNRRTSVRRTVSRPAGNLQRPQLPTWAPVVSEGHRTTAAETPTNSQELGLSLDETIQSHGKSRLD